MSNPQKSIKGFLNKLAKTKTSILGLSLIISVLLSIHPSNGISKRTVNRGKAKTVKPETTKSSMDKLRKEAIKSGRVKLRAPIIAENGAIVPVQVQVSSPMTKKDYVKMIVIIIEKNPVPLLVKVHFTPESGHAYFSTRVQFAKTSIVRAYAVMSDGKVYYNSKLVKVSHGCVQG